MRRQYKEPFRFTALPRELQLHMAEFLNLRDLKNLSLCSKAVRADVLKVLLREMRTPYVDEPCVLSLKSTEAVKIFHLNHQLYTACDSKGAQYRRQHDVHMAILPHMVNLQKLELHLESDYSDTFTLDKSAVPLPQLSSSIKAICALTTQATRRISMPHRARGDTLSFLLDSICARPITSLTLGHINPEYSAKTEASMIRSFKVIASHLDSLALRDVGSMGWFTSDLNAPLLRTLDVSLDGTTWSEETGQHRLLDALYASLQRCSATLKNLSLGLHFHHPLIDGGMLHFAPSTTSFEAFENLTMSGDAFLLCQSILPSLRLKIKTLVVDTETSEEWAALSAYLSWPAPLARLRQVRIRCKAAFDPIHVIWEEQYQTIRCALLARGVRLSISSFCISITGDARQALRSLCTMSEEVQELSVRLFDGYISPGEVQGGSAALLMLLRCLSLDFWLANSSTSSASMAYAATIRSVQAPIAQSMHLIADTPLSDYLPTITARLDSGAFPALTEIDGCFSRTYDLTYDAGVDPRWSNDVEATRKADFERVCSGRGIYIGELAWK